MNEREMYCLQFLDVVFIKQIMWCVDRNTHVLFGINVDTRKIVYSISLVNFIAPSNEPRKLFTDGEKIYITLLYGATVLRVDSNNLQVEIISCSDGKNERMMNAVLNKNHIYLFPRTMKGYAYICDLKSNEILKVAVPNIEQDINIKNATVKEGMLYGVVEGTNMILKVDLDTLAHSIHILNTETELIDISINDTGFFLLGNNRIIKCTDNLDLCESKEIEMSMGRFSHIVDAGAYILVVPYDKIEIYKCSKKNMCLERLETIGDIGIRTDFGSLFFGYKFHEGKIFMFPWSSNVLLEWDIKNAIAETYAIMHDGEFPKIRVNGCSNISRFENEYLFGGLNAFLKRIGSTTPKIQEEKGYVPIGEKIYASIIAKSF